MKKKKIYINSKKNLDDLLNNKSLILNQKEIDTLHIQKKHMANVKTKKFLFYQYYLEITIKLSPLLGVNSYVLLGLRSKPSD